MARLAGALFAKPWLVGSSVALLGAAATGGTLLITHHHSAGVHVRVLGERFNGTTGPGSTDGGVTGPGSAAGSQPTNNGGHSSTTGPPATRTTTSVAAPNLSFAISANVSGLKLGQPATLPVQVTNPQSNGGALTIDTIHVVVQDVTNAGRIVCAGGNIQVAGYDAAAAGAGSYAIPTGGSATVALPIVFADSPTIEQSSCEGQTFSLNVTGTATVSHA